MEHNLALARERSQTGFVPNTDATQAKALRINARVNRLAADAYYTEQEIAGARLIEPWSTLGADQQRVYVKRQQAVLASGIGYAYTKARDRAVRHVSTRHNAFQVFSEREAKAIETMLREVIGEYDTELIEQFKELAR